MSLKNDISSFAPVRRYLRQRQGDVVRLLRELIAVDTTNPPGKNYAPITDLLAKRSVELDLKVRRYQVPAKECAENLGISMQEAKKFPRINLVAAWKTGSKKILNISSHYDVVPATAEGWQSAPFKPTLRHGKIYGRGADDMKDSIAATLFAVEALRACGLTPRFDLELAFTADEETGGRLGMGYLTRRHLLEARNAICAEGGRLLSVGIGHRGSVWWEVKVQGFSAHACRPHLGRNAFTAACKLAAALDCLNRGFGNRKRAYIAPNGVAMRPTLVLGGIASGSASSKINIIPGEFIFSVDRRLVPGETVKSAEKEMLEVIDSFKKARPDYKVEINRCFQTDPCMTNLMAPLVNTFCDSVASIRKDEVELSYGPGFTDMHYLREYGMDVVGYGPEGGNCHGVDEFCPVAEIVRTAEVYTHFLMNGEL